MQYQEFLPIESLREHIRYFWVLEDSTENSTPSSFKIIPDGLPALIFQDEPHLFVDENEQVLPELFIYGQSTKYSEQSITGNFRIIGAYLQPTALKTIFNIDAFELNQQNIPLEQIISQTLLNQLKNTSSVAEKITIISTFLLNQVQKTNRKGIQADYATNLIQQGKSLSDVQLATNLSERSLERLVKQYVGLTPKMLSRVMRFQSSLNALRHADSTTFASVTYENEYFDQSHFIREFKEFTGTNPKNFIRTAEEQLLNFPKWENS